MKVKENKIIIEDKSIEIKDSATLIFGFAGVGLLGTIITNTMIQQIEDIEQIGYVASKELPSIAVFYDGILKHPFRIYYSRNYNLIIAICEVPFKSDSAYSNLSELVCRWALSNDVNEILIFQGIVKKGILDEFNVYYAAEESKVDSLEEFEIKKLKRGIIVGPEATFLNRSLSNRIDSYALFTEVSQYPTPEGAAVIIDKLNEIYGLEIDTDKLLEQGKKIKNKMLELAQKVKQYQKKHLKGTSDDEDNYPRYYR
jgi:uncharacterized protein